MNVVPRWDSWHWKDPPKWKYQPSDSGLLGVYIPRNIAIVYLVSHSLSSHCFFCLLNFPADESHHEYGKTIENTQMEVIPALAPSYGSIEEGLVVYLLKSQ